MNQTPITAPDGCYFDSHRGHYIQHDLIVWACDDLGYIIDPMARYVIDRYDSDSHAEDYPHECLVEIVDEITYWLNNGPNEGLDRAIKGQNSPPIITPGSYWGWNDGDYGLYADDELED